MKVFKCRRQKLVLSKGSAVEVARGDAGSIGAWYAAKIVDVESPRKQSGKLSKIQKVLVEYEQLVSDGESNPLVESVETRCLRPLPPLREGKQCSFKLDDSVEAKWRNGWWHGFVKMVLEDSRYCVCIDGGIVDDVFESSDLREHWSWIRGRWYPTEKKKEQEAPSALDDQGPLEESCYSKNMPKVGTELELPDVLEDSLKVKAIVSPYPAKNTEAQPLPRTLKTPYELRPAKKIKRGALIGNAASRRLLKKLSEGTVKVPSVVADQENEKQKIVEFNDTIKYPLRRRGKFAISKAKYTNTHKPGKEDNAGSTIKRVVQTLMQQDGFPRLSCVLGLQAEGRRTFMFADTGQFPKKELGQNEQNCKGKSHKRKRRMPQKLVVVRPEVPETGVPDASRREGANGSGNFEKKNDLCNAETSNTNEDQPLSTCSDGIHTPTCIEGSSESVSGKCRCLFVKTSPVWKMIESMEIFQTTPQNPHFSPLWACKEGYREGAAIGITATFASLTDKISNLLFDDPRCRFDSCLETLCDMEKHGFEVTAMRRRVNELLAIKEKLEQFQDGLKDAELEIADMERKEREISEEMEEIDKKMTELREKYAALKSEKERKDVEIAQLRMSLQGNNEQILSVRLEFEKLAALLPWESK
ncbi:DUF724 domain-containing protein 3-like isoform X2 [Rhodamnia argentea]|uniref:DUF724 domain-containing protein 3-like isoform X2 n=1 Tax=Rhodamnia argentea TaxID=178133 RepID=A0ABM3HIQ1_9MYRT|nr:DUF724 domain-containing protein 3-like isoform X2 [Rhodamnia argentea]